MLKRGSITLAALAAATLLTACGDGSEQASDANVKVDFIDETFAAKTVRYEQVARFVPDDPEGSDDVGPPLAVTGDIDFEHDAARMVYALGGHSVTVLTLPGRLYQSAPTEELLNLGGDTGFVLADVLPADALGKPWWRWKTLPGFDPFSAPGVTLNDPFQLMQRLAPLVESVEVVGTATVRGSPTEHLRVAVDVNRLNEDGEIDRDGVIDVWTDSEGRVVRIRTANETTATSTEYFDFGASFDIEEPAADDVFEFDPGFDLGSDAPKQFFRDAFELEGEWSLAASGTAPVDAGGNPWELWRAETKIGTSCWSFEGVQGDGDLPGPDTWTFGDDIPIEVPSHGGSPSTCDLPGDYTRSELVSDQVFGGTGSLGSSSLLLVLVLFEPLDLPTVEVEFSDGSARDVPVLADGHAVVDFVRVASIEAITAGARTICHRQSARAEDELDEAGAGGSSEILEPLLHTGELRCV